MRLLRTAVLFMLAVSIALGDDSLLIFRKLDKPLTLPPGLVQTLPINKRHSFFGDSLRAVDCINELDLPFGTCGDQLFGGLAMTTSHLTGQIRIQFYPVGGNIAHFEVTHGALAGDDSTLAAPRGFEMPVLFGQVSDAAVLSSGDLDLTTGGVTNIKYRVNFRNSALVALGQVNPKLAAPVIEFPGVRGHAWIRFEQRPDGLLDFTFQGNTFLPLGKDVEGDPVRFPLNFCGPGIRCASVLARGLSLHPHLTISTKEPAGPSCAPSCPEIPSNTIQEFIVNTARTAFGDDFNIDIPQLGGLGPGRSHIQGRLQFQFGPRTTEDTVPFTITSLVPEALLANPPPSNILGRGPAPGLLGQDEILRFPLLSYRFQRVTFVDEPYSFNHGVVDLRTGKIIGEFVYPSFYGQALAEALFEQNDGRVEKEPFNLIADPGSDRNPGYALFERGTNGQTVFRLSAEHVRSFATYRFPSPDFIKANSFIAGPGARLDLFLRIQAMRKVDTPRAVKSGSRSFVSSLGDQISINYSIPCDGSSSRPTFEYVNRNTGASGGTFRLTRLASVSCINSRGSVLAEGDYDVITFGGFGVWSKDDPAATPRLATVQISTAADSPYAGILVYQSPDEKNTVIMSSANDRPAEKPIP